MAPTRLLITGVTGYIGGTILDHLLNSSNPAVEALEISVLTRNDARADTFRKDKRITDVYTIHDLDDSPAITDAAAENDIVIQCAIGFHPGSPRDLIRGLARRRATQRIKNPDADVYYIHTDGTSNVADRPITKAYAEDRTFSDKDADTFEYLLKRNEIEVYAQRTTAIAVVRTGLKEEVSTTIIESPTIYGVGSGQFNRLTIQYPMQMRAAMREGQALYVGDGAGQWDYVHVQDLAVLYELVLANWLSGTRAVPTGEQGILFSETGNSTWKQVAAGIGKAGKELGVLKTAEPKSVSLEEAAEKWTGGNIQTTELGFSSNSRTKSEVAREVLSWTPVKTRDDWERSFKEEFEELVKTQKSS